MSEQESQDLAEAVVRSIIETAWAQVEEETLHNERSRPRKHV